MVNRSFVARYLSGGNAGRPAPVDREPQAAARDGSSASSPTRTSAASIATPGPVVYTCFSAPNPTPHFVVRTRAMPPQLAQTVRLAIKEHRTAALRL